MKIISSKRLKYLEAVEVEFELIKKHLDLTNTLYIGNVENAVNKYVRKLELLESGIENLKILVDMEVPRRIKDEEK